MDKFRLYQVEAAKDLYEKKRVLITDEMGMGKTAEAIAAKMVIDLRDGYKGGTLVACPSSPVTDHWQEEVFKWYGKSDGNPRVAMINTTTFDEDIRNARGADFTVIGYPTLSRLGEDTRRLGAIRDLGFYFGILDEAQNAKNPESIRSGAVREIFHSMPYLAVLSGTPIPNTIIDIYVLLNLLDKEQFPLHDENPKAILSTFYNLFREDPEFVSRVINEHRIRRTTEDYLGLAFPTLRQRNLEVVLEGEHRDVYLELYENDYANPRTKLIHLIGASIDPNLVPSELLPRSLERRRGKIESSVYNALENLIEESVDSGGKVLVFSDRRERVIETLEERLSKYGALVIDAGVSSNSSDKEVSERERIRRKFQGDPNYNVLISTTVMNEGVDLTAATDVVHLTLPYAPGAFDQRNRRSGRIGEVEKDHTNVHVVMPKLEEGIPVITEGIARLLDDKKRIIYYIEKEPLSLTKRDIEEIKNGGSNTRSRHLKDFLISPIRMIDRTFGILRRKGYRFVQKSFEGYPEESKHLAVLYANNWDGFYAGNTAEVYSRVIRTLEESESLERKLDIASGPFSLSRIMKEPVTNLDISQHMLDAGKLLEEQGRIVPGNVTICSPFHDLPLDSESFDLAVCSLGLHYSKPSLGSGKNKIHEREQAFREMNRVLRGDGYGIVTLPHSVIGESDFRLFYDSLGHLGFRVLPFSGFYTGEDSKFRVYVAGLQKVEASNKELLEPEQMRWKMDYKTSQKTKRTAKSRKKRKHPVRRERKIEQEFPTEFSHIRKGKSIEDLVRESLE